MLTRIEPLDAGTGVAEGLQRSHGGWVWWVNGSRAAYVIVGFGLERTAAPRGPELPDTTNGSP